jgi:hypothetical protein
MAAKLKIEKRGKGATQESFQQSLVDIGSVVLEEKFFFNFIPPFFLIYIIGQNG